MQKIHAETLRLVTRDCDLFGHWRPGAILEAMQEAAGAHAGLLGVGRDHLLEQNIVWVLSRADIRMDRYPAMGERVTVETFPHPCLRFFFPRYFVFRDEAGAVLGVAGTLWALVDCNTRRAVAAPAVAARLPDNADLTAPLPLPRAVPRVKGRERLFHRTAAYTELDVNGHVNNARYADWLMDALGLPVLERKALATLHLRFSAEILPEERLDMRLLLSDEACYLSGSLDGRTRFEAGGSLRPREA